MTYLVMENHASFTLVMDETGDFLKVANLGYSVGETLTQVQAVRTSGTISRPLGIFLGAVAASLVLFVVGLLQFMSFNYATVKMTINPDVSIGVMRDNKVRELKGLDADGKDLIAGYSYRDKSLTVVIDELVDRAIELEYLKAGGMLSLNLDSRDRDWLEDQSSSLTRHLNEYMKDKMDVTINVGRADGEGQQVVIPVGDARPPETEDIDDTDDESDDPDFGQEPDLTQRPTPEPTPKPTPIQQDSQAPTRTPTTRPSPVTPATVPPTPKPTPRPTPVPTYNAGDDTDYDDDGGDDTDFDDEWDDTDYD